MTELVVAERNKLSRRKKARAKRTLHQAFVRVLSEIDRDQFLRSHLFLNKPSKDKLIVGGYIVTKHDDVYNVYKKNLDNLLYENLYSFDAAMAIAESLNSKLEERVKEVVEIENDYADAYNDMMIFKNQYKFAIEKKTGNAAVFEDRYVLASERARRALMKLKRFRIAGK